MKIKTNLVICIIGVFCLAGLWVGVSRIKQYIVERVRFVEQRRINKAHYPEIIASIPASYRASNLKPLDEEAGFLCTIYQAEQKALEETNALLSDRRALDMEVRHNRQQQIPPGPHKIYFDDHLIVEFNLDQERRLEGFLKKYYYNGHLQEVYEYHEGGVTGISRVYFNPVITRIGRYLPEGPGGIPGGPVHREVEWGKSKRVRIYNGQGEKIFEYNFDDSKTIKKCFIEDFNFHGGSYAFLPDISEREWDCRDQLLYLTGNSLPDGDRDSLSSGRHKIFLDDRLWFELDYNSNGLLDGQVKEFSLRGKILRIYNFINGVEQEARTYYENGALRIFRKGDMVLLYNEDGHFQGGQNDDGTEEYRKHDGEQAPL